MPPLRDRSADVVTLAEAALARFAREVGRQFQSLDPDVKALFQRLGWPGNVRQLLNVMRHVVVLNDGPAVTRAMLPAELLSGPEAPRRTAPVPQKSDLPLDGLIGRTLAEIERLVIEETILRHDGSVPKAARMLDVSPSTLYRKMEAWKTRA
jgi:DNA-binding NtrC family response regulator